MSATRISRVERPLFALLLLCYCWPIDLDPGVNVWAHMDQAAAIVAHRTLAIDAFMTPPVEPNTSDWSRGPDGHFYPGKAPGCAFLTVPLLSVLYYVESALGIRPFDGDWFRRNILLVNWVMNALVSAMAMTLLLRVILSIGVGLRPAVLAVLAVALGSSYYPYATTYYPHNLAANLLIVAAFLTFAAAPTWRRDALVGLCTGFAVTLDYAAALAVLVFAGALAVTRPRALIPFGAGGLVPLAVLLWYHTTAFGAPTMTAYRFLNPRLAAPDGVLLLVPQVSTLLSLTVSPYRGAFFYSPVLLLAAGGLWCMHQRSRPRRWPAGCPPIKNQTMIVAGVALFVMWLVFNACYFTWWAGWTAGPRYLIPAIVLLAPAVAAGFAAFPKPGAVLLAVAITNQLVIATTLIVINDDVTNPLWDVIYPLFWRGEFQRSNLGVLLLGLDGLWSLAPFAVAAAGLAIVLARRLGTVRADLQGV